MKLHANKKGFTMAELLIVVAIIAVLVAVSVPVFSRQLDSARAATDAANIRSGYAQVASAILLDDSSTTKYYLKSDGTVGKATTDATYTCKGASGKLKSDTADASSGEQYIGSTKIGTEANDLKWEKGDKVWYEYNDSTSSITVKAGSSVS